MRTLLPLLLLATSALGCGDDQDPGGAATLWNRIHAENYRTWSRAPGYPTRRESDAPHSDAVDIYVNPVVASALAAGRPLAAWPVGSLIVKDGYSGSTHEIVAAMERRADGWYWAEWRASGSSIYSGRPSLCIDCHAAGSDGVRAFALPR
jgi:hypothetical protein